MKEFNCEFCEALFLEYPSKKQIFCSKSCSVKARGFGKTNHQRYVMTKEELAMGVRLSAELRRGTTYSDATRRAMSRAKIGEKCYLWKGGVTAINHTERKLIMNNVEYKIWRDSVFRRDDFTCRVCGKRGVYLEAHHVMSFSRYPELRLDIENGETWCRECHNKTRGKKQWNVQ